MANAPAGPARRVSSSRFDAILFDAGGILVVPDPVTIGTVVRKFGGSGLVEQLIRAHYAGMASLDEFAMRQGSGSIDAFSWEPYREAYVVAASVPEAQRATAVVALRDYFSPFLWRFPLLESVAALWRLHLKGVPVGIVSNASGQIEQTLASQCVAQVGEGAGVPVLIVTDSHVVGVSKPDPKIFDDALALLANTGVKRDRVAYVGDSYVNDVGGARNAGLTPILFDPYGDQAHQDCERITSLHELL